MVTRDAISLQRVLVVMVVGVVAVAGITMLMEGETETEAAIDYVPEDAETVVRIDMTITDDRTTQLLAVVSGASAPGAGNGSDIRTAFQNETGIDPDPTEEVVLFSADNSVTNTSAYHGTIVHTEATTAAAVEDIRNATDERYETTSYGGQTVYEPANSSGQWIGVLGDGALVVGSEAAVEETIGVSTGEADSFDGELRSAYDDTRNGTVTFATATPERFLPSNSAFIDTDVYRDVETVSGAYYISSGSTGIEMQLRAANAGSAQSVAQVSEGAIAIGPTYIQNESTSEALGSVNVTREERTVTLSYEQPIETFQRVLRFLYGEQLS